MICAITGHSGLLGSCLIKESKKKIKFIKFRGDISNKKQISNWILNNSFDAFIHLAAIVPIKLVNRNYSKAKQVNFYGTKFIVDSLKKKKDKTWFFYSSSSHVYASSKKFIKEDSKLKPSNSYGKLKLMAEKYIKKKLTNSKVSYCIGRIFSFTDIKQNSSFFIPSVFYKLKKEKDKKGLVFFKNVNNTRDFISIYEISRIILFFLRHNIVGIYNIASGKKVFLKHIVIKIAKILRMEKRVFFEKNNNYKSSQLVANIKKIKNIGINPKSNINMILKNYLKKKF